MERVAEYLRTELGLAIGDIAGGAESARLDLSQFLKVQAKIRLEVGVGTDAQFTLRQHDAAAAGNSKDLASCSPHYYKSDAASSYTKVEADDTVAAKDVEDLDTAAGIVLVEIDPSDLDVNNGFRWVSVSLGAPGAARQACVLYDCEAKDQSAHSVVL